MKKIIILTILALFVEVSFAQKNKIDSLSFNTDKGLLIIEGYLNDIKTNFAFDTGAGMGVLNSKNISASNIEITGTRKINDSQKNTAKIGKAKIDNLKIGPHNFPNITSVVTDMPFLYCNGYYLLGGDVINQLNWKFDFQKNIVYFSKTPFLASSPMVKMPVKIIGNRHFSSLVIAGKTIDNVLIDFGYSGNYTMDVNDKSSKQIINQQLPNNLYKSKSFSMGVNSVSIGKETNVFFVDSVAFGGLYFNNFKVTAMENTHNKIGLFFLKKNFNQLILNNTELKYWLSANNATPQKTTSFDAGCYFSYNRKIEVVALNSSDISTAKALAIGEEVKEINGRNANSFADKCEFSDWYREQNKLQEMVIVQLNGDKLTIKKSIF